MDLSRRALIGSLSALPLTGAAVKAQSSLPDKASYEFSGTYLNAAYVHPMNRPVRQAGNDFFAARANRDVNRAWPRRQSPQPGGGEIRRLHQRRSRQHRRGAQHHGRRESSDCALWELTSITAW